MISTVSVRLLKSNDSGQSNWICEVSGMKIQFCRYLWRYNEKQDWLKVIKDSDSRVLFDFCRGLAGSRGACTGRMDWIAGNDMKGTVQ